MRDGATRNTLVFPKSIVRSNGFMPEPRAPYQIEFYEDDEGHEPALAFMRALSPSKRRAIGVASNEFLAHLGPGVVETDFGKNLGGGLLEFRVDQDAEQILRKAGKDPRPEPAAGRSCCACSFTPTARSSFCCCPGTTRGSARARCIRTCRSSRRANI